MSYESYRVEKIDESTKHYILAYMEKEQTTIHFRMYKDLSKALGDRNAIQQACGFAEVDDVLKIK